MSHVSTVKLEIKDLGALKAACQHLGAVLHRDKQTYRYYSGEQACDHAITHAQAKYGVGVKRTASGSFELECDMWSSGGLRKVFGEDLCHIKQRYGATVARKRLAREGFRVTETVTTDGQLKLVATRMGG